CSPPEWKLLSLWWRSLLVQRRKRRPTVVTLQHDWPEIYSGETITLTCGIEEGGGSEWEYEWRTSDYYTPPHPRGSMMTSSVRGDYSCKGRLKDGASTTEWSDAFTLKTSGVPQPVLTVSPSWTSPGDSVTLTCSVEPPSAGWRFFWYQADSYSLHGQTHTAGYVCRAGRGDPVFYSLYSDVKFVWSGGVNPAASLTVSPHRLQHFSTESLSLSCEGNSAEWRVMKADESGFMSSCSYWGQMTGSTCNTTRASSGVYWCESATQSSNAANITTHSGDVILVSSVHPVTGGHSVTLGCMLRTKDLLHNVDFYKNAKLLPNGVGGELLISAVTKSDEGFYKCRGRNSPPGLETLTSAESWLSVEQAASSSVFLVPLVVGLVSGVLLIILLLLILRCYRNQSHTYYYTHSLINTVKPFSCSFKPQQVGTSLSSLPLNTAAGLYMFLIQSSVFTSCFGPTRSQRTNQSPATDHMINQGETQDEHYAALLHGQF
uniref:Ig-like domain-containing protein n=1 Tax=Gasterosteus aculeatus aculeatus TaxID=481459 RepID=A0AAQ4RFC2_GASAC